MKVIGLTGSIGMGKSTTASLFRRCHIPVYDADATVHRLYGAGGAAVTAMTRLFPDAVRQGAVDRSVLAAQLLRNPAALRDLEALLHPMLARERQRFLRRARARRHPLVVLDVPLLLETGGAAECDLVVVVSCPAFLQKSRALARPGMTPAKFAIILARQMPDAEKRRRADLVWQTGRGERTVWQEICRLRRSLNSVRGGLCGKSCWIPKPPGSIRRPATALSRSVASS